MVTLTYLKHAQEIRESNDIRVKRLFPASDQTSYDPFALVDEFFIPQDSGFPRMEYRGFEGYTYITEGALLHSDTTGIARVIESGGLQHYVAGRGLVHSETSVAGHPLCHGFRIWVNLPRDMKKIDPSYDSWQPDQLPYVQNQGSSAYHIVGNGAPTSSTIPLIIQDIHMDINAHHFMSVPSEMEGLMYCYWGEVEACDYRIGPGEYFFLPDAVEIAAYARRESRILLLAGVPLAEQIRLSGTSVE
ncbi:MAG: hypothetical protein GF401_09220 [Chitinivibrionales bacterium]|nr:hypothetical protein [Chitinivibrionales bacterium]